jgi:hypothetical protein
MLVRILFIMLMMPLAAYAGDKGEKKGSFIERGLMWVKTTIDSMAVA